MSTLEDAGHALRRLLGLPEPVAPAVIAQVFLDSDAIRRLEDSARDRAAVIAFLGARDDAARDIPGDLAERAAQSFWHWAKAGFGVADPGTVARRLAACDACPSYVPAPATLLHALAGHALADTRVCRHCGCFMAKKAGMVSSRCPEPDGSGRALSRWGEAFAAAGQPAKRAD